MPTSPSTPRADARAVRLLRLVLGGAALVLAALGAATFAATDAAQPPNYRAIESLESGDLLALGIANNAALESAYEFSQAVGETVPGATIVFPDGGALERSWTGMRLAGFGRASDVGVTTTTTADLLAAGLAPSAVTAASGAPATGAPWAIIVDPAGDQQRMVYVAGGPTPDGSGETLVEASLLAGLDVEADA